MPRITRTRSSTLNRNQPYSSPARRNTTRENGVQEIHPTVRWAARVNSLPPASLSDNEVFDDEDEEDAGDTQLFVNDASSGDETDAEDYLPEDSQATENNTLSNDDDETDAGGDSDATDAELTLDDDDGLPDVQDETVSHTAHIQELGEPTQPVVEEPTIVIHDDSVILIDENEAPEPVQIISTTANRSPKKSPKKKSSVKAANLDETVDNELAVCHICYENMKTDGTHEICALTSCGHIFGRECVTKWVKMKKECPNCKKRTTKAQIKKIYPSSFPLVAEDNSEIENLRKQIEEMSAANTTLRTKLNVSETELRITKETLKSNEAIIHHLRMNRSSSAADLTRSSKKRHFPKFVLRKEEKLIKETNQPGQKDACRLLAVDDPLKSTILCATSISSEKTTDFSTFTHGICVLDIKTMTKEKYVATHKATIKDIEFNSGYLLTGSMDKSMKVIDLEYSRITRNLPTTFPVWSVTWNRGKQLVYGGCKASIVEFDLRLKENKPTRTIDVPGGDYQQIHSLFFKNNGLLCGQYKMCQWIGLENTTTASIISKEDEDLTNLTPGNGMPFHVYGDNLLATFRNKPPQTKFSKLSFSPSPSPEEGRRLTNDVVKTFSVSHQHDKMLRDKLLNFDDHLVAACTNQQTGSLQLHDAHTGDLLQSLERAQNTILDCVQYRIGTTNYIAELDGRNVRFHEQQKI